MAAETGTMLARLQADQNAARRAQDKPRVLLLGMVISECKNREIELRRDLTDDDIGDVIRKGIKKRRESVALYRTAARDDLAAQEESEAAALEGYLPAQMDPEAIRSVVRAAMAAGAANAGAIMGKVMPQLKGKADGGTINAIVREELARG